MKLNEGDIFHWQWKLGREKGFGDAYWCRTQRAMVIDGVLCDLLWVPHGGKYRGGAYGPRQPDQGRINPDDVDLTFIANLADLVEIWPEQAKFYDADEVVDLRHSNNSNAPVMVRASATRSRDATVKTLETEIAQLAFEVAMTTDRLERKRDMLAKIVAGEVDHSEATP